jgi:hypothetical protein
MLAAHKTLGGTCRYLHLIRTFLLWYIAMEYSSPSYSPSLVVYRRFKSYVHCDQDSTDASDCLSKFLCDPPLVPKIGMDDGRNFWRRLLRSFTFRTGPNLCGKGGVVWLQAHCHLDIVGGEVASTVDRRCRPKEEALKTLRVLLIEGLVAIGIDSSSMQSSCTSEVCRWGGCGGVTNLMGCCVEYSMVISQLLRVRRGCCCSTLHSSSWLSTTSPMSMNRTVLVVAATIMDSFLCASCLRWIDIVICIFVVVL